MSVELKVFAVLIFLCALAISLAIRFGSQRISESIDNITINLQFVETEEEEKKGDQNG